MKKIKFYILTKNVNHELVDKLEKTKPMICLYHSNFIDKDYYVIEFVKMSKDEWVQERIDRILEIIKAYEPKAIVYYRVTGEDWFKEDLGEIEDENY